MQFWIVLLAALTLGASSAPRLAPQELVFQDLDGQAAKISLSENDDALVVHFWATWCPSCVSELGGLDRAVAACDSGGVTVVAVNVGETPDTVRRYWSDRKLGDSLRVLRDPDGEVWRRVGGRDLPTNLIWTHAGRRIESGAREASHWEATLREFGCTPPEPKAPPPPST